MKRIISLSLVPIFPRKNTPDVGEQVSPAAQEFILGKGIPLDHRDVKGDGLVELKSQQFTNLLGFPAANKPSAPVIVTNKEILHVEAPSQLQDLATQLNAVTREPNARLGGWLD